MIKYPRRHGQQPVIERGRKKSSPQLCGASEIAGICALLSPGFQKRA
ncbi:MAG: hypothetical protein K1W38_17895 [Lachnospiraceae bacterium]